MGLGAEVAEKSSNVRRGQVTQDPQRDRKDFQSRLEN